MPCRATPPCRTFVVQSLCHTLHSVLGIGSNVDREEPTRRFWGSTFMKLNKTNFLPFLSKDKHEAYPSLGLSLSTPLLLVLDHALSYRSLTEH
jgi:hypothetical protein